MEDEQHSLTQIQLQSWSDARLFDAVRCGHLRVLEWAHQNRLQRLRPLCPALCNTAATYGRIAVLEWLDAKGFKANAVTVAIAAEHGQLETLKWLRDRGGQLWELKGDYPAHIKDWLIANRRVERFPFEEAFGADHVVRVCRRLAKMDAAEKSRKASLHKAAISMVNGLLRFEDDGKDAQEKKLTTPSPEGISVQKESAIMSSVKVVSFGSKAFSCKACRSPNTWETREEVVNHCVEAHGMPSHLAQDFYVEGKIVPPCKKMGCGLCCTGLGPGNHKFLDKKGALEHLVNHLVYGHGLHRDQAIEEVESALPDDKDRQMEAMMAMIRELQAKQRMGEIMNLN